MELIRVGELILKEKQKARMGEKIMKGIEFSGLRIRL